MTAWAASSTNIAWWHRFSAPTGDRQRPAGRSRIQAQVKLTLPGRQPLPRRGLQQFQFRIVMSRADVLDVPRTAMRGVHDLHSRRARGRLHRPDIRHRATLQSRISAQICPVSHEIPQVSELPAFRTADRVTSQGTGTDRVTGCSDAARFKLRSEDAGFWSHSIERQRLLDRSGTATAVKAVPAVILGCRATTELIALLPITNGAIAYLRIRAPSNRNAAG
jgi:hypothetical protein